MSIPCPDSLNKESGSNIKLHSLALLTILFWSLAYPVTEIAVTGFSIASLAFLRCLIASVVLLIYGRLMHLRKPFHPGHFLLFAAEGLMGYSLYQAAFNQGMLTATSATSSLIIAMAPVFTSIGAWWLFGENLKTAGWICMCTAFLGVCILLLWDGVLNITADVFWIFLATLAFSGYNLLSRRLETLGYTATEIVTWSMCFGTLGLAFAFPRAIVDLQQASQAAIAAMIFLGIFSSAVGYVTWSGAMASADRISEVTNYMFLSPVLTVIAAAIMLHEIPNTGTYIGGAVILISMILFEMRGKSGSVSKSMPIE